VACGEPTGPPVPVASVILSPAPTVELVPGGSETIHATPKDSLGNSLNNRQTTWATSDPTIVTVAAGVATGVALGTATITATIEGHSASVEVHVVDGGVVGSTGASFTVLGGIVALTVPAGAVTATRNVTVKPAVGAPANPRVVVGTAFDFGPASLTFAQAATLTLKYDPNKVDSDSPESGLRLYESAGTRWRLIDGSTVNVTDKTVSGHVSHLGTYAVLMQPRVETVEINRNNDSLRVARTLQYSAILKDNEGLVLNRAILWSTSNASIVAIDAGTGAATGVYPGEATITATSEGKSASSRITIVSGPAASIVPQSGDGQIAPLSEPVPTPPSIKVLDNENVPVKGVTVTFAVTSGGGTVTGAEAVTNIDGIAAPASWTLGPLPGANTLSATSGVLTGSPVTFTANGVPAPSAMTIEAGNGQSVFAATAVPVPPSVKILDSKGRTVPGVTVTFTVQSGGGSITGGSQVTNAQGIATVGSWVLGLGSNTLVATAPVVAPVTFTATGTVRVQVVTFGDSNTDAGYAGTDPVAKVGSYVSSGVSIRVPAGTPNSSLQLAGKIEAQWRARRPQTIRVVNHGISGTSTGTGRTGPGAPNARTEVNGVTRFAGEVLGLAYPWSGGEPTGLSYPNGPILRVQAFRPRPDDFVYISMGTNDLTEGVAPATVASNLEWMIDQWIAAGLPADHILMTTLPPRSPSNPAIPTLNNLIRGLGAKGIHIVELTTIVSDDNGLNWKSTGPQPYVSEAPPVLHYAEWVRDALADLVVTYISSKTP
jgi:uncharacterized protein YjdB/lysophospholipase L1-like esterase